MAAYQKSHSDKVTLESGPLYCGQIPPCDNDSVWHVDRQRKKSKTEEDGSYQTLKLAMETDETRKARLEKMVATTQLRLAFETEEERRTKMDWI